MDIKSVNAPAIGQKGIERIIAWARPKRMTSEQTTFDMGYEQAKRDLLEIVYKEVGIPADHQTNLERRTIEERQAQEHRAADRSLISRFLNK